MTFLTTKTEIEAWLQEQKIFKYSINSDWSVDVEGSVKCRSSGFIPVQFGTIRGSFNCSGNQLTSLRGAPKFVAGNFSCSANKLTSLEFSPLRVEGHFDCFGNKFTHLLGRPDYIAYGFNCSSNALSTLHGAPSIVEGSFDCSDNLLTSLEFCPHTVADSFICSNNKISSLEFCPVSVGAAFWLDDNPALKDLQYTIDFQLVYEEHLRINKIISEQQGLNETLGVAPGRQGHTFKL